MLLAFLKQTLGSEHDSIVHKRLVRQVWYGVGAGILICLVICAGVIGTFYTAGRNTFDKAENIWEGAFAILASVIITLMGAALLRVSKLQDKWRVKISKVLEQKDSKLPITGRICPMRVLFHKLAPNVSNNTFLAPLTMSEKSLTIPVHKVPFMDSKNYP